MSEDKVEKIRQMAKDGGFSKKERDEIAAMLIHSHSDDSGGNVVRWVQVYRVDRGGTKPDVFIQSSDGADPDEIVLDLQYASHVMTDIGLSRIADEQPLSMDDEVEDDEDDEDDEDEPSE